MPYNLPPTEIESSCRTRSDCPANFPALFTSATCPFTSYPDGTATSPSDGRGASSVAREVCPGCAFSESIGSSSRIPLYVPDGTVTFLGGGGGWCAGGGCASGAGARFSSAARLFVSGGGGGAFVILVAFTSVRWFIGLAVLMRSRYL